MPERTPANILVVEDEKNLGLTLVERLEKDGFLVTLAGTADDARSWISKKKFNLCLMDVGLPDGSGFEVAELLRKEQPAAALIFLTAHGTPEDRVHGLELGAEDYIVKPFHLKELLLRVQNGLKRARYVTSELEGEEETVQIGKAVIHFVRFEVEVAGKMTPLTHKETALLRLLVNKRGKVVSRDEILDHVWSKDEYPSPRTIDNFIMRLRRLVEVNPEDPQIIRSVRGVGYQLN